MKKIENIYNIIKEIKIYKIEKRIDSKFFFVCYMKLKFFIYLIQLLKINI